MYHRNSNYVLKFINLSVSNKPRKLIHFGKQIKIKIREFHAKQLIKNIIITTNLIAQHLLCTTLIFDLTYGNSNIVWTQDWRLIYKSSQSKKFKDYDHHLECFP